MFGQRFTSLGAAARQLSYEQMVTAAGCYCRGREFDPGNTENNTYCDCINAAAIESCQAPVVAPDTAWLLAEGTSWTKQSPDKSYIDALCGWTTFYLERFINDKSFSVARYNDGEWLAMELAAKHSGQVLCTGNPDRLPCNAKFVERLLESLSDPILLGSTWAIGEKLAAYDRDFFFTKDFIFQSSWDFKRHTPDADDWHFKQQFLLNDIIHGLVREHPADLTATMLVLGDKTRFHVTGVGPQWLGNMRGKIPFSDFIQIEPKLANEGQELPTVGKIEFEMIERLRNTSMHQQNDSSLIRRAQSTLPKKVFLISASMMTNVVIADLFATAQLQGAYLIDIGSGFDPLINDTSIARRTGTQAQELYRNPSEKELKRMLMLLRYINEQYARLNLGTVPSESNAANVLGSRLPVHDLQGARNLIQAWM